MIDESTITFAGAARDRADDLRRDDEALAAKMTDPRALALALWKGKPLMQREEDRYLPAWLSLSHPIFEYAAEKAVLMGIEGEDARFALDVSRWQPPADNDIEERPFSPVIEITGPDLPKNCSFIDLRSLMASLSSDDANDLAAAKGVLEWHASHRFCAKCGAQSAPEYGGWRRRCESCNALHFPRTDPVVIQLILHDGKVLLGRNHQWPEGTYSLLAGFMEPGESIEDAVRRETFEETGIKVGAVRYLTSQPWPFPSSLMIGCMGIAQNTELTLDPVEIEDARWFSMDEVASALREEHEWLRAGRPGAVAWSILNAWIEGEIED